MKRTLQILLALSLGCVGSPDDFLLEGDSEVNGTESPVVFGDSFDLRFLGSPDVTDAMRDWADGVAILMPRDACRSSSSGTCSLNLLRNSELPLNRWCDGEEMANHERLLPATFMEEGDTNETCTTFFVGNNHENRGVFVTAGHCVVSSTETNVDVGVPRCEKLSVVFDYQHGLDSGLHRSVDERDVYRCQEVRRRLYNPGSTIEDYAVFEVDRAVVGHRPLPIRRSGGFPSKVMAIGHPMAMPKTVSLPTPLLGTAPGHWFTSRVDHIAGNSGSPMIDPATGIVHGILVSGPDDFETSSDSTGECLIHRECPGVVCDGPVGAQAANAVDISLVAAFVPAIPAVEVRGDINDNGTDDAFVVRRGSLTYEATIELDGSAIVTFDTLIPVGTPLELDGSLDVVLEDLTLDGIDDLMVRVGPTRLFVAGRSGLSLPNVSSSWSGLSELAAQLPASLLSMTALDATSLQSTGTLKRPIVRLTSGGSHVTMHGASTGLAPTYAIPSRCGRTSPFLAPDGSVHTSSRAVAFVPAADSGVGTAALLVDCPGDAGTTSALVALSPIDGRELGTLSLDRREAWGSFSYRSVERDLLAIQQTSARAVRVYSIGLAGSNRGRTRLLFSTTRPTDVRAFGWDARTREVVMIEQGTSRTSTSLDVVRLSETGTVRSSTTRTSPCPSNARIVGAHVVDGTVLGACAQTSGFGSRETIGRLVRLDGASSTVATLSDFVGDMTCDTSTFPGQSVVWGIGIGGTELNAIHVPASACQATSFTGIRPIRPILPRTLTTRF